MIIKLGVLCCVGMYFLKIFLNNFFSYIYIYILFSTSSYQNHYKILKVINLIFDKDKYTFFKKYLKARITLSLI